MKRNGQRRTPGKGPANGCGNSRPSHSTNIKMRMKSAVIGLKSCKFGMLSSVGEDTIPRIYSQACPIVSARKNIQPRVTSRKVRLICSSSRTVGRRRPAATVSVCRRFRPLRMEGRKSRAWKAPQATNVQLAPCHSPLMRKMAKVLRTTCRRGPRLPPRGM